MHLGQIGGNPGVGGSSAVGGGGGGGLGNREGWSPVGVSSTSKNRPSRHKYKYKSPKQLGKIA